MSLGGIFAALEARNMKVEEPWNTVIIDNNVSEHENSTI